MPHTIKAGLHKNKEAAEKCPVCDLYHSRLIHSFNYSYEGDVLKKVQSVFPEWEAKNGICGRCYDEFEAITYHSFRAMEKPLDAYRLKYLDFYILPIPERINADISFTGKGVTICIIDSGFYLHPDFKDRVIKMIDITDESNGVEYFKEPHDNAWHGTMTSTVCAGNGSLSRGLYRGLASDANLVLIKIQNDEYKITDENIAKALCWVIENHRAYNIKIVNLSLSGETAEPYGVSEINKLAENLFKENVLVVAAVGNNEIGGILPPASSPHVVAVGGFDDRNKLDGDIILYHSSYGITIDGLSKPELISNAIWLPAPILPGTKAHKKAGVFFKSLEDEDSIFAVIQNNQEWLKEEYVDLTGGRDEIWKAIKRILLKEKFISPDYMHVDGTSFAAPIVTSVAAQMMEANPLIAADEIRKTLLSTALPLPGYDIARQGYGMLQPKIAVYAVMQKKQMNFLADSPILNKETRRAIFYIQIPNVKKYISLVSSFNNWKKNEILLRPAGNDTWYVDIPILPAGRYEYKFYIDDSYWLEDISNPWRVTDNHGGWNNVFEVN
jgi:serine protease AprX